MKFLIRLLFGIAVLIVCGALGVFGLSAYRTHRTYGIPASAVVLPTDTLALKRGEHLAAAFGKCAGCHGDDYGGKVFIDAAPLGHIVAPNLTRGRGGVGATMTDAQLLAAITHGVRADGSSLFFMPSAAFAKFSRADAAALVAYIRSRPPVNRESPAPTFGSIGRILVAFNQLPLAAEGIDHQAVPADSVVAGVDVAYGKYLADVGACTYCHNPAMSGGRVPKTPAGYPVAANLTKAGIPFWTLGDFRRALREGIRPEQTPIDSFMPWPYTKKMTDAEIDALWLYIQSLPPRELGKR